MVLEEILKSRRVENEESFIYFREFFQKMIAANRGLIHDTQDFEPNIYYRLIHVLKGELVDRGVVFAKSENQVRREIGDFLNANVYLIGVLGDRLGLPWLRQDQAFEKK